PEFQFAGAHAINMQIAAIPPGAWSKAHKHAGYETAIYVLSGEAGMWYGEKLEDHLVACAGDFFIYPAGRAPFTVQSERSGFIRGDRRPARSPTSRKAWCCSPSSIPARERAKLHHCNHRSSRLREEFLAALFTPPTSNGLFRSRCA